MSTTHRTCRTPNPAERSLVVTVPESTFASSGGAIPPQGTLYSSALFKTYLGRDYMKQFSDFVYVEQVDEFGLLFAPGRTAAWLANPTPFRTTEWTGNHRWPPILVSVDILADYGNMRSFEVLSGASIGTAFAPTYYDQIQYIPDVAEGTRFVKEEFLSPLPFDIPQSPVPTPTAVQYILPGGGGNSFPECLHPRIEIEAMITSLSQNVGGVTAATGTTMGGQLFPETNFTEWAPYVLSDTQELNGGWYRTRIRVFPPAPPDVIQQISR